MPSAASMYPPSVFALSIQPVFAWTLPRATAFAPVKRLDNVPDTPATGSDSASTPSPFSPAATATMWWATNAGETAFSALSPEPSRMTMPAGSTPYPPRARWYTPVSEAAHPPAPDSREDTRASISARVLSELGIIWPISVETGCEETDAIVSVLVVARWTTCALPAPTTPAFASAVRNAAPARPTGSVERGEVAAAGFARSPSTISAVTRGWYPIVRSLSGHDGSQASASLQ